MAEIINKKRQLVELGKLLNYEQPINYIVNDINYNANYNIPVLTAGKSFILGYTNENSGIYDNLPVIIFDDFTTESKFVNFKFKVKSSAMKLLTPKNNNVYLKYIFYVMKGIKLDFSSHKRYYLSQYSKLKVPFPSLPIQKQIASQLEQTEKLTELKQKNIARCDELIKNVFYDMFGDPIKNEKGFEIKALGEICNFVRGPFGGSLKKEIFKPTGYAVYEQQHAIYNQFDNVKYFIDENKFNEMKRFELNVGDLIMSCSGTMGKIAIVPKNIKKGIINQALLKITPLKKISITFLKFLMLSKDFQDSLKIYSQGIAIQNVVSVKIIKQIKIIVPPIELQNQYVKKVELIEKLKQKQIKSKNEIDNLFNSLMQKYFYSDLND